MNRQHGKGYQPKPNGPKKRGINPPRMEPGAPPDRGPITDRRYRGPVDTLLVSLARSARKALLEDAQWHRKVSLDDELAGRLARLADGSIAELFEGLAVLARGPAEQVTASKPQPPPDDGDVDVAYHLTGVLRREGMVEAEDLVRERVAFGLEKYGTRLHSHNGRNPIEDARQELGDAMQYVAQAIIEGRDLAPLLPIYEALGVILGYKRQG